MMITSVHVVEPSVVLTINSTVFFEIQSPGQTYSTYFLEKVEKFGISALGVENCSTHLSCNLDSIIVCLADYVLELIKV